MVVVDEGGAVVVVVVALTEEEAWPLECTAPLLMIGDIEDAGTNGVMLGGYTP